MACSRSDLCRFSVLWLGADQVGIDPRLLAASRLGECDDGAECGDAVGGIGVWGSLLCGYTALASQKMDHNAGNAPGPVESSAGAQEAVAGDAQTLPNELARIQSAV